MSGFFRPVRAWKDKLIVSVILLAVVVGMKLFGISCPIYAATHIPCPTCGMTRAWIAALTFDFATAFSYHALFWTVPLLYVCFLYDGRLFRKAWANTLFYIVIGAAFLIRWLIILF